MARPLNRKPGSRHDVFTPDRIETYTVGADSPKTLMAFLLEAMPDRKRTTVKELLAHDQVAVGRLPVRQFDAPPV